MEITVEACAERKTRSRTESWPLSKQLTRCFREQMGAGEPMQVRSGNMRQGAGQNPSPSSPAGASAMFLSGGIRVSPGLLISSGNGEREDSSKGQAKQIEDYSSAFQNRHRQESEILERQRDYTYIALTWQ
ncbi:hypothetical protein NDU88_006007 [Pleurodeles waltl]|uniref:Uncharacterized protein n=1 Tax=Pleurodeles waltl TaxID=8319 RepID=A0AAV7UNR3_PLEWA|nr:hypothetical protein NDU88_006007 [Pleurodeles waltl]